MSDKIPTISILMPVKNTGKYLKECLDSIFNQTFKKWELIAVDDGSSDDSLEILKACENDDNRIMVFTNNGSGIIDALRHAYSKSSGNYITRMDSDDVMMPEKLQLMVQQLQTNGKGFLAVGLVEYFSEDKLGEGYQKYTSWLNHLTRKNSNFSDIYKECSIPSPCWMVIREDLDVAGAFASDIYPEDYDLAFRFRKTGMKISGVNKVLHRWRDYSMRTSRTHEHYSDNRFARLKVMHFISQDRDENKDLILWGAGKKGKQIAKLLTERDVKFIWVTNNPKKIGRHIYNILLEDVSTLDQFKNAQIIIVVSSPNDQNEIRNIQFKYGQNEFYEFC